MSEKQASKILNNKLKLSAVIAIEEAVRKKRYGDTTKAYHIFQKTEPFIGFVREFQPIREDEARLDGEQKNVTNNAIESLKEIIEHLGESLDCTATKDYGNQEAKADVKLEDGTVLLEQAPVSFLLFMEKQLKDIRALIDKVPTLDPAKDWSFDANVNRFVSPQEQRQVTRKVQKPLVLHAATKEHPAQTQVISVDEPIGTWVTRHHSTALPNRTVKMWQDRLVQLEVAIKTAREEANSIVVQKRNVGKKMLSWLFEGVDNPGAQV